MFFFVKFLFWLKRMLLVHVCVIWYTKEETPSENPPKHSRATGRYSNPSEESIGTQTSGFSQEPEIRQDFSFTRPQAAAAHASKKQSRIALCLVMRSPEQSQTTT